jgi:hypothetical protein
LMSRPTLSALRHECGLLELRRWSWAMNAAASWILFRSVIGNGAVPELAGQPVTPSPLSAFSFANSA